MFSAYTFFRTNLKGVMDITVTEERKKSKGALSALPCGLNEIEVEESRKKYGRNIMSSAKRKSFMKRLLWKKSD